MARPKKPVEEKRSERMMFYLTEEEKVKVEAFAENESTNLSELARTAVLNYVEPQESRGIYLHKTGESLTGFLGGADLVREGSMLSEDVLNQLSAEVLRRTMMKIENPPVATYDKIMTQETEQVRGFICGKGHLFWIEWVLPKDPLQCPVCGSTNLKRTWWGQVKKER